MKIKYGLFVFFGIVFSGCTTEFSPKPKGFPRLTFPKPSYQLLTENHPYQFEYSTLAVIKPDTFKQAEPHWIFINYPSLNANVQLTYKPVLGSEDRLRGMITDAYKLTSWHQQKAYNISDEVIRTKSGRTVAIMNISGDVPSHYQFFTTDSTRHFLRGAVYLRNATEDDSLAPIVAYLKRDVQHLLNTLRWKK